MYILHQCPERKGYSDKEFTWNKKSVINHVFWCKLYRNHMSIKKILEVWKCQNWLPFERRLVQKEHICKFCPSKVDTLLADTCRQELHPINWYTLTNGRNTCTRDYLSRQCFAPRCPTTCESYVYRSILFKEIVTNRPKCQKPYPQMYAPSIDTDQPAHSRSLIRTFSVRISDSQGCKVSSSRQRRL